MGYARVSRFGGDADEQWSALLGLGVAADRVDRDVGLTGTVVVTALSRRAPSVPALSMQEGAQQRWRSEGSQVARASAAVLLGDCP